MITVDANWVRKVGPRAHEQGLWLRERAPYTPHLPQIIGMIVTGERNGYVMERLYPCDVPNRFSDVMVALDNLHGTDFPFPKQHFDVWELLNGKFYNVPLEIKTRLLEWSQRIDFTQLDRGFTHGDPTAENTMQRADGTIVFIDPLPSTAAVPDLTSVDYGKVLQSVYGWEAWRYNRPQAFSDNADVQVRDWLEEHEEWDAANFWCVVHLVRALPYMKEGEQRDGLESQVRGWLTSF